MQSKIFRFLTFALFLCITWILPVQAGDEVVKLVSISSKVMPPGFVLELPLHALPHESTSPNPAILAPKDWLIELDKDLAYPQGIWGVQRVYFPPTDLSVNAENIYRVVAPVETGHYRFVVKNGIGDIFATEVFQVVAPVPTSPQRQIVLEDNSGRPSAQRPFTCPVTIGQAYKSSDSSAVYLVVEPRRLDGSVDTSKTTCTRRAFKSSSVFFTYFPSWSEVRVNDRIKQVPDDTLSFLPFGKRYMPQNGTLLKSISDPKVYRIQDNKRYWITSEVVFIQLGFQFAWIEDVSEELLQKYALGNEISNVNKHPFYTLIRVQGDARVYLLSPDPTDSTKIVKRHITTEGALQRLGYRLDRIVIVGSADQYPNGAPLE